ncbi:unnamed protein product [Rhizophagus irregularis]|nr:unnamed protein product [Rhizophagus irregularis]
MLQLFFLFPNRTLICCGVLDSTGSSTCDCMGIFYRRDSSFWTWKVLVPWVKGMESYKRYYYLSFILDRNLILVLLTPLTHLEILGETEIFSHLTKPK